MGKIESRRDLIVWQKAMDTAVQVYKATSQFPSHEKCGMTSQVTRATASVAANNSEGNAHGSAKDYAHFLAITHGSLMETETFLPLAVRLDYLRTDTIASALSLITEIDKMLCALQGKLLA